MASMELRPTFDIPLAWGAEESMRRIQQRYSGTAAAWPSRLTDPSAQNIPPRWADDRLDLLASEEAPIRQSSR